MMLSKLSWSPAIVTLAYLLIVKSYLAESFDASQETRCLDCIRNVTKILNIDTTKRCEGYFCGPFQLSYTYWSEAGKPGNNQGARDYEKCARDKTCAEQTVRGYFKKFKRDCNNDGLIDCRDMAALHKGGPASCSSDWFYKSRYWVAFNKTVCMTNEDESVGGSAKPELVEQAPSRVIKNQTLTSECLDCICDAISGCNTSVNNCGSGTVCGPFAISQAYWKDGRRPGASWTACTRTKECSSVTIKNYMEKYKKDCNGDGFITCEDYAAIHRRGPRACANKDLFRDHYWNKFLACRASQKPSKDVNMVKVNDSADELSGHSPLAIINDTSSVLSTTQAPTQLNQVSRADHSGVISYSSSTNPPQETNAATSSSISSSKHDIQQTPTYELTSVVLDIKDDNASKAPASKLPPLDAFGQHPMSTSQNGYYESNSMHSYGIKPTRRPEQILDHRSPNLDYEPYDTRRHTRPIEPLIRAGIRETVSPPISTEVLQTTQAPVAQHTPTTISPTTNTMAASNPTQTTLVSAFHQSTSSSKQQQQTDLVGTSAQTASSFPQVDHQSSLSHQTVAGNEEPEYSVPDFSLSSHNGDLDRGGANSFDKVVTNIVGSPDFSKSYPPIPDIVMQGKQSQDSNKQQNDYSPQPTPKPQQKVIFSLYEVQILVVDHPMQNRA